MYFPVILRGLCTLIFFSYFKKLSCLQLFLSTILLDFIDCTRFTFGNCDTYEYKKYDKIADVLTYMLILYLYGYKFDNTILKIIWTLVVYRLIGVVKFFNEDDISILHRYFDGVNSTILVSCYTNSLFYVGVGLLFKIQFEKWHHKKKYIYKNGENLRKVSRPCTGIC